MATTYRKCGRVFRGATRPGLKPRPPKEESYQRPATGDQGTGGKRKADPSRCSPCSSLLRRAGGVAEKNGRENRRTGLKTGHYRGKSGSPALGHDLSCPYTNGERRGYLSFAMLMRLGRVTPALRGVSTEESPTLMV